MRARAWLRQGKPGTPQYYTLKKKKVYFREGIGAWAKNPQYMDLTLGPYWFNLI